MKMFQVKLLNSNAIVPTKATPGSAGSDLYAAEELIIPSKKWKAVSTGISIRIPTDCYARIAPRSGLAFKNGIDIFAGVVDSDYRGEIKVIMMNNGESDFEVKIGDRIAQIIFERIYEGILVEEDELDETKRGEGGFGSSGK